MPRVYMPRPDLSPDVQRRWAIEAHTKYAGQPPVKDPASGDVLFSSGAVLVSGGSDCPTNPVGPDEGYPQLHRETLMQAVRYWRVRLGNAEQEFRTRKARADDMRLPGPTAQDVERLEWLADEIRVARAGLAVAEKAMNPVRPATDAEIIDKSHRAAENLALRARARAVTV